jgi:hypothetical protein
MPIGPADERSWGATATPGAELLQPQLSHAGREPSRGAGLTGRPKPNLARSPGSRQHRSMANSPSAAFLRLRAYIAEWLHRRPFDQPLMR